MFEWNHHWSHFSLDKQLENLYRNEISCKKQKLSVSLITWYLQKIWKSAILLQWKFLHFDKSVWLLIRNFQQHQNIIEKFLKRVLRNCSYLKGLLIINKIIKSEKYFEFYVEIIVKRLELWWI